MFGIVCLRGGCGGLCAGKRGGGWIGGNTLEECGGGGGGGDIWKGF